MDPVELRLKNCFKKGDSLHTGQPLVSVNIEETIKKARDIMDWRTAQRGENRALGISCGFCPCGGFATSSVVELNMDGTAVVSTGAMDMGQGLRTVMTQITAEEWAGVAFTLLVFLMSQTGVHIHQSMQNRVFKQFPKNQTVTVPDAVPMSVRKRRRQEQELNVNYADDDGE